MYTKDYIKTVSEKVSGFDWDDGNIQKCQKHGVSIEEIEALFSNPKVVVGRDIKHSQVEERLFAIGMSTKERYIYVIFTFGKNQEEEILIRPISVRYMHQKEIKRYEEDLT